MARPYFQSKIIFVLEFNLTSAQSNMHNRKKKPFAQQCAFVTPLNALSNRGNRIKQILTLFLQKASHLACLMDVSGTSTTGPVPKPEVTIHNTHNNVMGYRSGEAILPRYLVTSEEDIRIAW